MISKSHLLISTLILQLFLIYTNAIIPPSEISALKAFKTSIKPSTIPPSSCLSSWDFSIDPCSIPRRTHFICGLTCSSDSTHIISITLDSVSYSGKLTPLISQLAQLVVLDLGQNAFYGTIPSSISSLATLQFISFRSNSFSGPLPSSIGNMTSLQELDFSNNMLSGSIPNTLISLSKLTRLDLSFNKLTGNLPKLPPNLLELAIKANSLSGPITKSSFSESTRLSTIELSSNSFTGILQGWFFQLPSLQQINLSNNTLTRVEISKPVNGYSNIVAIDLGYNKIEGYLPVEFTEYSVLAALSLRYNKLRGPIPLQYGTKGSLKRLYLDGNYLMGAPPAGFFGRTGSTVSGSIGDNCLKKCPVTSQLCLPSQKPMSVCKQVYGGKRPRINN